ATYFDDLRKIWIMIFEQFNKHKVIKNLDPQLLANEFISYLYVLRIEFLSGTDKDGLSEAVQAAEKHVDFIWDSIKR
ncbi:MAG: TetR/AcrR family transcriptional regulator, partial [Ignavibacteria bacterium]